MIGRWSRACKPRGCVVALLPSISLIAALVFSISDSAGSAALAALLLLGSLRACFLPRTYELHTGGARDCGPLQTPRRLAWADLGTVTLERHGIHLSPLHRPSRWVADRGVFLRTGQRDGLAAQVAAFVQQRQAA